MLAATVVMAHKAGVRGRSDEADAVQIGVVPGNPRWQLQTGVLGELEVAFQLLDDNRHTLWESLFLERRIPPVVGPESVGKNVVFIQAVE